MTGIARDFDQRDLQREEAVVSVLDYLRLTDPDLDDGRIDEFNSQRVSVVQIGEEFGRRWCRKRLYVGRRNDQ